MKLCHTAAVLTALWLGLGTTSIALSQNTTTNTTAPSTTAPVADNDDDGFPWGLLGLLGLAGLAGLRRRDDSAGRTTNVRSH